MTKKSSRSKTFTRPTSLGLRVCQRFGSPFLHSRIRNAKKSHFSGVSLSIARGEFIVVFGLSGGGKTTLMNIIGTVDTPTKGSLSIDGYRTFSILVILLISYERYQLEDD